MKSIPLNVRRFCRVRAACSNAAAVAVAFGAAGTCSPTEYVLRAGAGTIANPALLGTAHGTQRCPWVIRPAPGQTVRLTLSVFSAETTTDDDDDDDRDDRRETTACASRMTIVDADGESHVPLCGDDRRDDEVYNSHSNDVTVFSEGSRANDVTVFFEGSRANDVTVFFEGSRAHVAFLVRYEGQ